jgi:hypothetical protein
MEKTIRLTETDLVRLVKKVINEMDKKEIIKSITQGEPSKHRSKDFVYSADYAIKELEDYVLSNLNMGKNQLLKDMERIAEKASEELSDDEFDKFTEYYDDIKNRILQELSY